MAVNDPTTEYGWDLPVEGGSTDDWGNILNEDFGEDDPDFFGSLLGSIDTEIGLVEAEIDAVEASVDDLDERTEALVNLPVFARVSRLATGQTIPDDTLTTLEWDTEDIDVGGMADLSAENTRLTVPGGSRDGLYQIRGVVEVPVRSTGDDGREWEIQVLKNGATIAVAHFPWRHDGHNSDSGTQTLVVETLDVAATFQFYELAVRQTNPDSGSSAVVLTGVSQTYFEAVRLPSVGTGIIYHTACWTQYTAGVGNFFANSSVSAEWSKLWWGASAGEASMQLNTAAAGGPCEGERQLLLDPTADQAGAFPDAASDVTDVDMLLRVHDDGNDSTNYTVYARTSGGAGPSILDRGVGVRVNNFGNVLEVVRAASGTETELAEGGAGLDLDVPAETAPYWLRVQVFGTTIRARAWASAASEPGTWDVEFTSLTGDDLLSGAAGIWTNGGSQSTKIYQLTIVAL